VSILKVRWGLRTKAEVVSRIVRDYGEGEDGLGMLF